MRWMVLVSAVVAAGRFTVPGHGLSWPGSYEALAHIWVGVLLGECFRPHNRRAALACLVAITVLETVMFFVQRK